MEHIKFFIPTSLLPKDNISGEIALVTGAVWWNLFSPVLPCIIILTVDQAGIGERL